MARADYAYSLWNHGKHAFIVIEDLNKGKMSVTNDIENVVEEIAVKASINPVEYYIIYRDSERLWDGYNFATQQFIPLRGISFQDAMDKFLSIEA